MRRLVLLLALVLAVVLAGLSLATGEAIPTRSDVGATKMAGDVVAVVPTGVALVHAAVTRLPEHPSRSPSTPSTTGTVLVCLALAAALRGRDSIDRSGSERLTDAGDDWRSLLLGAPPARL